jgi:hypothetical protein
LQKPGHSDSGTDRSHWALTYEKKSEKMLAEQFADANIASRKFSKTQRNNPSHPSETIMTKKLSIHHTSKRSALFLATAAAALLATTQFSEAKKPDPAVTSAVASASTTDIEEIVEIGISIGNQIATGAIKLSTTNVNALVRGLADCGHRQIVQSFRPK